MNARIVKKNPGKWTNKHNTVTQPIDRLYDIWNPKIASANEKVEALDVTVQAMQSLIEDAIADNHRLRAIGSGWSISDVAAMDGRIVNTKPLNWIFQISEGSVSGSYEGSNQDLLLAQCGASIAQLNEHLVGRERSLKTQGASNGQTIVGAFSTGSHGSAIDIGAIENYVVGLHLIVGPSRHIWLERASYPVVSDQFVQKLHTELVRNDSLFNAALVSFGSFGIIHAAMIETEPIFLLESHRMQAPVDDVFQNAINSLDFSELPTPEPNLRPYHFDVVINPYDLDDGAFYTVMYKRPYRNDYPPLGTGDWGTRPGDDFLHIVGLLSDDVPALIPSIVNGVINGQYRTFSGRWGTIGEIFSYTSIHGGGSTGSALGIPLERTNEALELLLSVIDQHGPFAGVFGLRFVKKSKALLGFTRFDRTCVIDIDGADSKRTRTFFRKVWDAFDETGIPYTLHWGKAGDFTRKRVWRMYDSSVDEWLSSRQLLLDENTRFVFSNPFLERAGLDEINPQIENPPV